MTEHTLQARKDFSRIGLSLLVIGIVSMVAQALAVLLWNRFLRFTALGDLEIMNWVLTFAPIYLIGIPSGLLIMKTVASEPRPVQKLGGKGFWMLMLMCIPIMYGGNLIGTVLSALLSGGSAQNPLMDYVMGNPLYSFLFAVVLAPLVEEYLFRKQIIDRVGKYGEKTAVLFSALTFALFHMNLFQFFYAFGLGVLFAYAYTRTRALRYSVAMHMIINCMGSVIAPMLLNNLDLDVLSAMESGTATSEQLLRFLPGLGAYLLYCMLLLAGVGLGALLLVRQWSKRRFSPTDCALPPKGAGKTVYGNAGVILFMLFCLIMIVLALI